MKPKAPRPWAEGGSRRGFTLLELLVVFAIIGLLASLVLPAVLRTKTKAQVQQARMEINQIVSAITEYHSCYGRFPVSDKASAAAAALNEDVTYGAMIEESQTWIAGPRTYLTNNCEVTAILLDLEAYGDGAPTINQGHIKNPRRGPFLSAMIRSDTNALPGVGVDGIYRDPWGSPYLITMDLNEDGRTRDFLYRYPSVSENPQDPSRGLKGTVRTVVGKDSVYYEVPVPVIVWSSGPNRQIATFHKANYGMNRDNLLSWQP